MLPEHLNFVSLLHTRGGLLSFLNTFENQTVFDTQAGVVTNQMQGREFESGVVTSLLAASRVLWRFTSGPQQRLSAGAAAKKPSLAAKVAKFNSLDEIRAYISGTGRGVGAARDAAAEAREVKTLIAKTNALADHVEKIKVWFAAGSEGGSSGEVLARITAYMPTASFVFRPAAATGLRNAGSGTGGELLLEYSPSAAQGTALSQRQTLNPELLAEMVRGALLSRKDAENSPEQCTALDDFVDAYHAAVDVHAQLLHLESVGHPDYCHGRDDRSREGATVCGID
jgi:hypothetical protein